MDEDNDGNKSMRFGGGCFDSLQLCSYKEIQSNDSAKNFHNTSLKGSYDLGLFLLLEKMRKERWPCLNPPRHTLCRYQQTVFGPPLPTNERVFFFHSLWHFQTDTTQGWQCSGWALSLGRSAGPRPPRAASLNLESCCWYRSHHGSSVPGTSLPTRSPREDPKGKELSAAMENRGCVMCLGLLCASPNLWMLLAPEKASQEGREKPATNVW